MSSSEEVLEARFLGEPEFPAWRDFVDTSPAGSIYSYPEYLDVLCRVSGGSFRVLVLRCTPGDGCGCTQADTECLK